MNAKEELIQRLGLEQELVDKTYKDELLLYFSDKLKNYQHFNVVRPENGKSFIMFNVMINHSLHKTFPSKNHRYTLVEDVLKTLGWERGQYDNMSVEDSFEKPGDRIELFARYLTTTYSIKLFLI